VVDGDSKNSIVSNLIQTFTSWISGDRVRIAPSHGRALTLQPGDRIFIDGRCFLVQSRTNDDADPQLTRLVYELIDQKSERATTLEVVMRKDGTDQHETLLKTGPTVLSIGDSDITIM
jgi:hypothetical protein